MVCYKYDGIHSRFICTSVSVVKKYLEMMKTFLDQGWNVGLYRVWTDIW